ncbi:sigma-54-dependent Fis family transcriptional regulator [Ramlibacter sp. RBP-2]|uniref:Sigma-54-dependent Fis family transcriptional regulator n=1 Tax=Ramlibacter lithotrophicus TaxID=2606681 RepID=A0A7X6DGN9_9BURK|nr:sigma-54 dependent transcriptional regulator [Ramlibacter lithotrophicus]NKE66827.1 sigma-54-dependent Fis family transcriptional regulator [Ramlibacter lithotrophicus]
MPPLHVLVVDDELALRQILADTVKTAGDSVELACGAVEAAAKLAVGEFDVALCDVKMPDGNGIELLRRSRAAGIDTTFIMVTGFASLETAVAALRAGASDYITKPVHRDEVLHRLSQISAMRGLRDENKALRKVMRDNAAKLYRFTSAPMLEVERLVGKVAPAECTVLVTGESGTGKGVVARLIHEQSARSGGPFLQVNCSAIPEQLLESEFFGHTKGAFTGADAARKGLFQQADGGTLFLDEIAELPSHMQTKLLHMVEDKEVRPVGSEQVRRVDTRIIAATNADLPCSVRQGRFREDLYFRLSMFQIHVPPLRERQADIRGLIQFLLGNLGRSGTASCTKELDPLAEEVLLAHRWPGNVRELENVITRACILAEDNQITVGDLPAAVIRSASPQTSVGVVLGPDGLLRDQLRKLERQIVLRAIEEAAGDRRLAAQRLGIALSSLYRKLEESLPDNTSMIQGVQA